MSDLSGGGPCPVCRAASYFFDVNEDGMSPATCVECGCSFDVPWLDDDRTVALAPLIGWATERLNAEKTSRDYRAAMVDLLDFLGVDHRSGDDVG